MKLYGFVCENPNGELYVTHWFFSPEDRQKYVEEGSAHIVEVFGEDEAWVYEKHYWFTEVNTKDIPYIHCGIGVDKLEEEREAKLLAEEEEEV